MRFRIILSTVIILLTLTISGCGSDGDLMLMAMMDERQVETKCIWDKAPHCAFTDLTAYNGKLYCCFREGYSHAPVSSAELGGIRILVSDDGDVWRDCGLITDPDYDLRDPKLSVTPDNRLTLLFGRYLDSTTDGTYPWTQVMFFTDEQLRAGLSSHVDVQDVNIENNRQLSTYWLWRIRWIGRTAYGVAYKKDEWPLLVKSNDGVNYSIVTVLQVDGNEADVEVMSDGRMVMFIRGRDDQTGFIGTSESPYIDWSWTEILSAIHCPAIITIRGSVFMACRSVSGTDLYYYDGSNISPIYRFESSDDNAYPGLEVFGNMMYISYYSSEEDRASIYVSRVSVDYLAGLVGGK